jgi:hypothetical protein
MFNLFPNFFSSPSGKGVNMSLKKSSVYIGKALSLMESSLREPDQEKFERKLVKIRALLHQAYEAYHDPSCAKNSKMS